MNKTKIEWADYSWNPIKGLCPEACWYCYARRIYERFDHYIFGKDHAAGDVWLDRRELDAPLRLRKSPKRRRIFVCSTFEIFNPIADGWRSDIFRVIERNKDLDFIILTKRPERIDRPIPPNVWLGVSLTGEKSEEYERVWYLSKAEAQVKFVSFEPLLRGFDVWELFDEFIPDWMIVGRLTGHGTQRDTSLKAIQDIVDFSREDNIPVFLKPNIRGIWPGPLIQEYPCRGE